eukprot:1140639-Pelagomonas_calceolata.AAC.3
MGLGKWKGSAGSSRGMGVSWLACYPYWQSPPSEATPEGRWVLEFHCLLTPAHCGPLTPPQALRLGMPWLQKLLGGLPKFRTILCTQH